MQVQKKFNNGFSLIELIAVIAVMGGMLAIGIGAYSSFNGSQALQIGASDVVNLLAVAKSRSISQVKPPQCAGQTLTGYQISLTPLDSEYTLSVVCNDNAIQIVKQDLPPQVIFANDSTTAVSFAVSTGSVSAPAEITLSGYGKTKVISVSAAGTASVK